MVSVPAVTPVTTPVLETTVAIELLLLLQSPPIVALFNAVVKPAQTAVVPVLAVDSVLTVKTFVDVQPAGNE